MVKFSPCALVMLVMCCCWANIAATETMKYKDPNQPLNVRIKDLMDQMTLEEKIGKMTQIDRAVASADVMQKYFIGSILSGRGSVPAKDASPEMWINMVNEFQRGSLANRLGLPMIYGIDAVHGNNNVYKATIFPHNVGLGVTRDPELITKGIDENNTVVSQQELFRIHMPAYYDSVVKGVASVMISYSSLNGAKMHQDHQLITNFFKNTLNFRGFVISDWEGIDRITDPPHANYTYSILKSVGGGGLDMVSEVLNPYLAGLITM